MSYVQDRIDGSTRRIDAMLDGIARREAERQRAEDAEREEARRVRMRDNAERRREFGARYADAFAAFGVEMPPPVDNESAGEYRKRLFNRLVRKLPRSHSLADVRADDIPGGAAARNFEQLLLEAVKLEAERPSPENLPRDGSLIRRDETDPMTGAHSIKWLGKESFIKSMGRPSGRVLRIIDRKNNNSVV
jgi:hypothetical protein